MAATNRRRCQRGQSTVELALVLPVLIVAVLVVLQILLVARDATSLTAATRAGARAAMVHDDAGDAAQRESRLEVKRLHISVSGGDASGSMVTVVGRYESSTAVPIVGLLIGDVTLEERIVVRRE